jgi:hypothetical protein
MLNKIIIIIKILIFKNLNKEFIEKIEIKMKEIVSSIPTSPQIIE